MEEKNFDIVVLEREERLSFISKCRRRCMREAEIIKAVKLELGYEKYSERDLHNDYELLISDWRKRKEANIDFLQMEEYMKRQELIDEAWQQWEISKEIQRERRITKRRKGLDNSNKAADEVDFTETAIEKQGLGEAKYLYLIAQQLSEQAKIMRTQQILDAQVENINLSDAKFSEVKKIVDQFKPKKIGVKSETSENSDTTYIHVTNEVPMEEQEEDISMQDLIDNEE